VGELVLAWVAAIWTAARGARAARGTAELALWASNERVKQLNRMLRTTWSVSQLIARTQDRKQLLEGACRIFVEEGGLPSAWVGIANFETGAVLIDASAIMDAAELGNWVRAFNDEVVELLEELTRELGLALDHLHHLAEHRSAEAALKQTEAKLIAADRLGSVGRLAAGVAHEINVQNQRLEKPFEVQSLRAMVRNAVR
jgi:C4-dicarboxylate-specific signal transduction histidine kinase